MENKDKKTKSRVKYLFSMSFLPPLPAFNFEKKSYPVMLKKECHLLDGKYRKMIKDKLKKDCYMLEELFVQVITYNRIQGFLFVNCSISDLHQKEQLNVILDDYVKSVDLKIDEKLFLYNTVFKCAIYLTLKNDNKNPEEKYMPKMIHKSDVMKYYKVVVKKASTCNFLYKNESGIYKDIVVLIYYISNHVLILKPDYIDKLLKHMSVSNCCYDRFPSYELALELAEIIFCQK